MYVDYNITCGEGRQAFFNITSLDMEGKVCEDPNRNNEKQLVLYQTVSTGTASDFVHCYLSVYRCVDYVHVYDGNSGFTSSEYCGDTTVGNSS